VSAPSFRTITLFALSSTPSSSRCAFCSTTAAAAAICVASSSVAECATTRTATVQQHQRWLRSTAMYFRIVFAIKNVDVSSPAPKEAAEGFI